MADDPQPNELYYRYKTSTELVLNYLDATGRKCGCIFESDTVMTCVEMIQAAKTIASKVTHPKEIYWALRSSISDRLAMAALYKERTRDNTDVEVDKSHRHFVNHLSKIRKILFAGRAAVSGTTRKTDKEVEDMVEAITQKAREVELEDRLEVLEDNEAAADARFGDKIGPEELSKYLSNMTVVSGKKSNMVMEGDEFIMRYAEIMDLHTILTVSRADHAKRNY